MLEGRSIMVGAFAPAAEGLDCIICSKSIPIWAQAADLTRQRLLSSLSPWPAKVPADANSNAVAIKSKLVFIMTSCSHPAAIKYSATICACSGEKSVKTGVFAAKNTIESSHTHRFKTHNQYRLLMTRLHIQDIAKRLAHGTAFPQNHTRTMAGTARHC